MLNLLGTIGGNVIGLPGILGVALGMMTRNWILGACLGGLVGVVETFVFAGFEMAKIGVLEFVIAVCIGMLAGAVGSGIRIIGATV